MYFYWTILLKEKQSCVFCHQNVCKGVCFTLFSVCGSDYVCVCVCAVNQMMGFTAGQEISLKPGAAAE